MPDTATGDRLRAAISGLGITPAEAARRIGIHRQSLHKILTGGHVPTLDWLHSAATALGIDPHELDARLSPIRVRK